MSREQHNRLWPSQPNTHILSTPVRLTPAALRQAISARYPGGLAPLAPMTEPRFSTGIAALDALFPDNGIPYGQLIELSGGRSSGKTGVAMKLLAQITASARVLYLDPSHAFFPPAAVAAGVTLAHLVLTSPPNLLDGLRIAEQMLERQFCRAVLCDLTNRTEPLPLVLMHRLRLKTVRAKGLILFLTNSATSVIPSSMTSLRLIMTRQPHDHIGLTVARSRLCREGIHLEVSL